MTQGDPKRIPKEVVDAVVPLIYKDARRLRWQFRTPSERTNQYDLWVADQAIGGRLIEFVNAETARSWIKDGPMKEYARAEQGAGRYARHGKPGGTKAANFVTHALGKEASIVKGTVRDKPFQCAATVPELDRPVFVTWGEPKKFKYLVWASLSALADNSAGSAAIVVTESLVAPATGAERRRFDAIAKRCGIALSYYRLVLSGSTEAT